MKGKSLLDYPQLDELKQLIDNHEYSLSGDEATQNYSAIVQEKIEKLNIKQREVFIKILDSVYQENVEGDKKNCFFIDGPGGSGKTFLYETLWYYLKMNNKNVCSMAFTGIAATLLPQGKTVHKVFKLPVPFQPVYFCFSSSVFI